MKKERVIVLTDIGSYDYEADDAESLIRLMLYSNEIDLEGIIPTTSHVAPIFIGDDYMDRCYVAADAYKEAYPNLKLHADGYPDPDYIRTIIKMGSRKVHMRDTTTDFWDKVDQDMMKFIGFRRDRNEKGIPSDGPFNVREGCATDGSRLIEEALLKDDDRPIWFLLWSGCGALGQALFDLKQKCTYEEMQRISAKVYMYDIDGQDDVAAWICKTFPKAVLLRSDHQFQGMSQQIRFFGMRNNIPYYGVGNLVEVEDDWIREHIQAVGPLGKAYPDVTYGIETDTPTLLYVLRNGLNDPYQYDWGGWGGRFTRERSQNPPAGDMAMDYLVEERPFYAYREETDTWRDEREEITYYNDPYAPISRWRQDYQNDMAARMQWQLSDSYEQANHNPIAILNGDATKEILMIQAQAGDSVMLDASASYDPDGDGLSYKWYIYPEAGTYPGEVSLTGATEVVCTAEIPTDAVNEEIHVILEVLDDHGTCPMKSYRRAVILTGKGGRAVSRPYDLNDADINPASDAYFEYIGSWEHRKDQYAFHYNDYHASNTAGDQVILHFYGTQVRLTGGLYSDTGILSVSVDGGKERLVDTYSQTVCWKDQRTPALGLGTLGEEPLFATPLLEAGGHTIVIKVTGEKNPKSSDCRICIDRAIIYR